MLRTGGSPLLVMLMHAAGNAALLVRSGLALPQTGLAGWLLADNWLNVLAYGGAALLVIALARGRLDAARKA